MSILIIQTGAHFLAASKSETYVHVTIFTCSAINFRLDGRVAGQPIVIQFVWRKAGSIVANAAKPFITVYPCDQSHGYIQKNRYAVESRADYLVTHNVRHLQPAARLGLSIVTPREFLLELRRQI